jgi:hypothetical protein
MREMDWKGCEDSGEEPCEYVYRLLEECCISFGDAEEDRLSQACDEILDSWIRYCARQGVDEEEALRALLRSSRRRMSESQQRAERLRVGWLQKVLLA